MGVHAEVAGDVFAEFKVKKSTGGDFFEVGDDGPLEFEFSKSGFVGEVYSSACLGSEFIQRREPSFVEFGKGGCRRGLLFLLLLRAEEGTW